MGLGVEHDRERLVEVISGSPIGPRACSFWVEMPISAPNPNSPPSVNRVEALTITAAASTSATQRRAAARSSVTIASVWPVPRATYLYVVSSRNPIGPRACSFWVELPISAPIPNSKPSVKRVDALT